MRSKSKLALVLGIFALFGCQTVGPESVSSSTRPDRVQPKTVLPEKFGTKSGVPPDTKLVLAKNMLKISKIIRPKAEVRSGPGAHFQLVDVMLYRDTSVYLFERVGVWQKVFEPTSKVAGWVHFRVLDEESVDPGQVSVATGSLPTVFAMTDIDKGYAFPERSELAVHIPKGTIFKSLKKTEFGTLVWLPQTNSVMWLTGEVVQ